MGYAETFKAVSDPVRREILLMLKNGKMTVGEIGEHFDIAPATLSHHLSILKNAELVHQRKHKNFIFYELSTSVFEDAMLWFAQFKEEKQLKETAKQEILAEQKL